MTGVHIVAIPFTASSLILLTMSFLALKRDDEHVRKALLAGALLHVIAWVFYISRFILLDTGLEPVLTTTSPSQPLWMRVAASWSNPGGSIVLFTALLSLALVYLLLSEANPRIVAPLAFTIAVTTLAAHLHGAFQESGVNAPIGSGLNPLLKSPWVFPHPLTTFGGYALLLASALVLSQKPLRSAFVLYYAGWGLLTTGIAVGGYWSYETFGWGGYWAWDPVETSQLAVWLGATLYPHLYQNLPSLAPGFLRILASSVFLSLYVTRTGMSPLHGFGSSETGSLSLLALSLAFLASGLLQLGMHGTAGKKDLIIQPLARYRRLALLAATLSLILGFLFVYASLLVPGILQALGREAQVPQLESGVRFYHPVLYPLFLLAAVSYPIYALPNVLGRRLSLTLTLATAMVSIILAVLAYTGRITPAPLDPPSTNFRIMLALPLTLLAASACMVEITGLMRGSTRASAHTKPVARSIASSLLHFGFYLIMAGVLLSGAQSFNEAYMQQLTLTPGENAILPQVGTISVKSAEFKLLNQPVNIRDPYIGRVPSYTLAWEALLLIASDYSDALHTNLYLGENILTLGERIVLSLVKNPLPLGDLAIEVDTPNLTIRDLVTGASMERTLTTAVTLHMSEAELTAVTGYVRDNTGTPTMTIAHLTLTGVNTTLTPSLQELLNASLTPHIILTLTPQSPLHIPLNTTHSLQATRIHLATQAPGRILALIEGKLSADHIELPTPLKASRYLHDLARPWQGDELLSKLLQTRLAPLLANRTLLATLLHDPEYCTTATACPGVVKTPRTVPEAVLLEINLQLGNRDLKATIRFEVTGEVQGIHGLVPSVQHPNNGLRETYIVFYPPQAPTPPNTRPATLYHSLLTYYVKEVTRTLPPQDALTLTTLLAAGYNSQSYSKLPPTERAQRTAEALADLLLAAERLDPQKVIEQEGILVEYKTLKATQLIWLGTIISSLTAIIIAMLEAYPQRKHTSRNQPSFGTTR